MRLLRKRKGFTLLEILIVIVILGVVAGLAVPVYTSNINKAKAQEALAAIAAVKSALSTYWSQQTTGTYVGATFSNIGFDPSATNGGQAPNFTYALSALGANAFTITASCTSCGASSDTIVATQSGTPTRNGIFA